MVEFPICIFIDSGFIDEGKSGGGSVLIFFCDKQFRKKKLWSSKQTSAYCTLSRSKELPCVFSSIDLTTVHVR